MTDLVDAIASLTREQALEAAGFLGEYFAMESPAPESQNASNGVESLTAQPFQNIEEIEELARLALMSAALTPGCEDAVQDAIAGAGNKQFILGGPEIVALALLALGALQAVITKGKVSEDETITITLDDEKTIVEIHRNVKYGISRKLAEVLKSYFESMGIWPFIPSPTPTLPSPNDDQIDSGTDSGAASPTETPDVTVEAPAKKFRRWPWKR